jgi:hypothetical protein
MERKDSIQAVCWRIRRLEAFLYLAAQNFDLFSKIQDQNLQKKTYRGWYPFLGLSYDTTLMQIWSGRTLL